MGVPLCTSVLDGYAPDQAANRFHIDQLAGLLPPQHEVTFVADAKLCDAATLGRVLDAAFHFVTLVPRSFSARHDLVERVRREGQDLPVIGAAHRRLESDVERLYRGTSFTLPFEVADPETGMRREQPMRLLVVASPGLEEREEGVIRTNVDKEHERLVSRGTRLAKKLFSCEADAVAAATAEVGQLRFHDVDVRVSREEMVVKRERRGRPRIGETTPTREVWRVAFADIRVNDELVEIARFHGRHFVLVTDHLDGETWPVRRHAKPTR